MIQTTIIKALPSYHTSVMSLQISISSKPYDTSIQTGIQNIVVVRLLSQMQLGSCACQISSTLSVNFISYYEGCYPNKEGFNKRAGPYPKCSFTILSQLILQNILLLI
ncbi:unnamed protein product [Paramecium octaurelia]|uniref:Uncharacterized protein n=1 Tax=Paramecium octaurelia TaxID=43137 RepID=A0A8S1WY98_PAROT|nr:unnamed protein product [Paramecium octaurelia]